MKTTYAAIFLLLSSSLALAARPVRPCKGAKCTPPPEPVAAKVSEVVGGEKFISFLLGDKALLLGTIGNYETLPAVKVPTVIPGLESGVTKLMAGPYNLCAIKSGDLYCYGDNDYNQLAQGLTGAPSLVAAPVKIMSGVKDAAMGFYHGCAIDQLDDLYCFGDNPFGAFGNGTYKAQFVLPPIKVASGVKKVIVSEYRTSYLTNAGEIFSAGYNSSGVLGLAGSDVITFGKVSLPALATDLIDGYHHTLIRVASGQVHSVGFGAFGELANGIKRRDNYSVQTASLIPTSASKIFAQAYRSCWLANSEINCVGTNRDGVLTADENIVWDSAAPIKVQGLAGIPSDMIKNISGERGGNTAHSCAITSAGLECWGNNQFSQLGGESSNAILSPKLIQAH